MIKVISFTICPFVQRVTALLEAKDIPYTVEYISLSDKPEWFMEISPNGQVPVLVTEKGTALFESDAIVEYLEEAYAPLEENVDSEQKALDRAWSYLATKHYLVQCTTMSSADSETFSTRLEKLNKAISRMEKTLGDGPYFKGDRLSNIDIAWLPLLHRAAIIEKHTGCDFFTKYPKVQAWQREVLATGLAEKSVAVNFEEAFTGYYLSGKTFLGSIERCGTTPDSCCGASSHSASNGCSNGCCSDGSCSNDCCSNGCCSNGCCSDDCCTSSSDTNSFDISSCCSSGGCPEDGCPGDGCSSGCCKSEGSTSDCSKSECSTSSCCS